MHKAVMSRAVAATRVTHSCRSSICDGFESLLPGSFISPVFLSRSIEAIGLPKSGIWRDRARIDDSTADSKSTSRRSLR